MRVLGYYGAYAYGTPEYDTAMQAEEAANGTNEIHKEAKQGSSNGVQGGGEPDGSGPSASGAASSVSDAEAKAGSAGSDSTGDGHSHAGIPKFEEAKNQRPPSEPASITNESVKAAVLKLDPENNSHWVATGAHAGKPRLNAVEDAFGKAGLTRQDIEAALPGWNRDRALDAVLSA
jgi:hypothetical protein